jgi:hypothetical protein
MNVFPTLTDDFQTNLQTTLKFANCIEIPFYQTPYFCRYFNSKNKKTDFGFYELINYITNTSIANKIWNNISIDYFQNYESTLEFLSAKSLNLNQPEVQEWLRNNITHRTFFHMISHSYGKSGYVSTDNLLKDTFNQLSKMLKEGCEIEKPKRWRIGEFHDHISFLFLKRDLKIVEHETTFIPVPHEQERWKVYQPKDTLELALWGKKVGNCVLSYEEKIMGKQSVIVLVEEDSSPKYTIELGINGADFHIKQATVRPGNTSLTSEETQFCTQLIQTAIQK